VAKAGDIVAVIGLKFAVTGDTLSTEENPVLLESIQFPEPVVHLCVFEDKKTVSCMVSLTSHR
jgi:elongation factor G